MSIAAKSPKPLVEPAVIHEGIRRGALRQRRPPRRPRARSHPGPRDVLVRVRAASINPLDKMVRNGEFKLLLKYKTPFVLGHDLAGVMTQVGNEVRDFRVGDEVYSRPRDLRIGAFAEYIAIDQADIARKPKSLTMEEAAAVPLVALAAWQALVELAQVRPGQKVLIHAGAGGLGSTVIQLAKHLGAFVATTARGTTWTRCVSSARTRPSTTRRPTSPMCSPATTSSSTLLVAPTSRSR